MTQHTSRHYEQELQALKEKILLLGGKVEEMIGSAMRSLLNGDAELAREVIASDPKVDASELEIDHLCLNLLALRQPAASDLRFIATALKIVTDLERIGDLAVNIAERSIELSEEPPLKPYIDIPRMASAATGMVKEALDAFVKREPRLAIEVLQADAAVDQLNVRLACLPRPSATTNGAGFSIRKGGRTVIIVSTGRPHSRTSASSALPRRSDSHSKTPRRCSISETGEPRPSARSRPSSKNGCRR